MVTCFIVYGSPAERSARISYNDPMLPRVLGLDIGGANLKAAHSDGDARTVSFPLWKHPDRLADELVRLCSAMPAYGSLAITMTGELCDCFTSKRDGVHAILQCVRSISQEIPVCVWSTHSRFLDFDEAMRDPLRVAAANWLAVAHFVAQQFKDENVLLIDTGSTTTDIIYLNHGNPEPRGLTDVNRLTTGELVYTGVRRTPICAMLGMEVAAEFFATMLDAYLLDGSLPENAEDCDTADGRPATRACAHARLARMCCADVDSFSLVQAQELAARALRAQRQAVGNAVTGLLVGRPAVQRLVVSGSGEMLGRTVAAGRALVVTSFSELLGPALSDAACAYAVAMLAAQKFSDRVAPGGR